MFSFREYLLEGITNEEFNLNDAKGKLFEILAGSHLRHGADEKGRPAAFLTHYRDENDRTPEAVHNYVKREMEKRYPGTYDQINQHAREAAEHVRSQMGNDGHKEIHDVAWTSQPSDHKSFTGNEDPNSDADVMLKTNKGHVGISLKYGSQKIPNLRNPGLASVESLANLKKGEITNIYNNHQNNLSNLGFSGTIAQNHAAYKANKSSDAAKNAEQSSLDSRRLISKKWQDGYSKLSSDELRDKIVSLVSPETIHPHYRLHTRPTTSGVEHHIAGVQDEVQNSLKDYAEFKSVPHSGQGITTQILGRHHNSDEWHPVATHAVKGVSGPMKGFAGTTKLSLKKPKASSTVSPTSKSPKRIIPIKSSVKQSSSISPKESSRLADDGGPSGEHGGYSYHGPGEKEQ
jgi:hypothetical protein